MEVEIKLNVRPEYPGGPESLFRQLLSLKALAGLALGPVEHHTIHDVYYDTADKALARAGAGLRLRVQDGASLVTLKRNRSRKGALTRREEYEEPLDQERLNQVLAHVADPIGRGPFPCDAFLAGQPCGSLVPVLRVMTTRQTRPIGRLAMLALDHVIYGAVAESFYDIEIEAQPGVECEAVLEEAERELFGLAGPHIARARLNKLQRGIALQG